MIVFSSEMLRGSASAGRCCSRQHRADPTRGSNPQASGQDDLESKLTATLIQHDPTCLVPVRTDIMGSHGVLFADSTDLDWTA